MPEFPVKRVMIVDDDPVLCAFGAAQLEADGYAVVEAQNGAEALDALRAGAVDVIVSDVEMPVMDGFALLKAIRADADQALSETPVVMVTGLDDDDSIRKAYEIGATSFLPKPVNWFVMSHHLGFVIRASENAIALRRARDEALSAARAKGALMVSLRHELRSPLHVIQGFASLLAEQVGDRLGGDQAQYFHYIVDAAEALNERVSNLFAYADYLNGDFTLSREVIEMDGPVREAVRAVDAAARDRGVTIRRHKAAPVFTDGDVEKLASALANILHNAVKFSPDGGVVDLRIDEDAERGAVRCTVVDDGAGIDPARAAMYLKGFEQADSGLTRSSTGIGLGLTIANCIAEAHGGTIEIGNEDGRGARVRLVLPSAKNERAASAA